MTQRSPKHAFTLIELLVVVAIIAILALIAVPNLLQAQVRAKVSRVKADMRTVATALEVYVVDENKYPFCDFSALAGAQANPGSDQKILERLSTPVAYVTASLLEDPFHPRERRRGFTPSNPQGTEIAPLPEPGMLGLEQRLKYVCLQQGVGMVNYPRSLGGARPQAYVVYAGSPLGYYPQIGSIMRLPGNQPPTISAQFYDPTNGTVSYGAIFRTGGGALGEADPSSFDDYGSGFFKQAQLSK